MPAVALSRVVARVVESGPGGQVLAAGRGRSWRRCLTLSTLTLLSRGLLR
jgi:hypothetical protein